MPHDPRAEALRAALLAGLTGQRPRGPSSGFRCFIRHADGRVEDVTPGRPRTTTRPAKPVLTRAELRAQTEALRTGYYNRSPAGSPRARIRDMERRLEHREGRAFFESILGRKR